MVKIERQRYIFFKIIKESDTIIEKKNLLKTIWQSLWRYFGMKGANKIGLWLYELKNDYGIIRCSQNTKEILITALTLILEIDGERIIISPIKTSGTIKTLKKKIKTRKINIVLNK